MRNIELKARLHDPPGAKERCRKLNAEYRGDIRQVDTYFRGPEGRLKLRLNEPGGAQLVFYRRPDLVGPKASDYFVEPVPAGLVRMLRDALETVVVVEKVRTLYLWKNVRIHVDHVHGLGDFIEFEAVLASERDTAEAHRHVAALQEEFGLSPHDFVPASYADLVAKGV